MKKRFVVFFDDGIYGSSPVGYVKARSLAEAKNMLPPFNEEEYCGYDGVLPWKEAMKKYAPNASISGSEGLHDGGVHYTDWTEKEVKGLYCTVMR